MDTEWFARGFPYGTVNETQYELAKAQYSASVVAVTKACLSILTTVKHITAAGPTFEDFKRPTYWRSLNLAVLS